MRPIICPECLEIIKWEKKYNPKICRSEEIGQVFNNLSTAQEEAERMFKNTNADVAFIYFIPTKKNEWAEYQEWCKR